MATDIMHNKVLFSDDLLKAVDLGSGIRMEFTFDGDGKVIKAQFADGTALSYQYKDLLLTQNTNYNQERIAYVYNQRGLLTKVSDQYGVFEIGYEEATGRVVSYVNRKGCVESYAYGVDKDSSKHLSSKIIKKCGAKVTAQEQYDLWYGTRSDGSAFLERARRAKMDGYKDFKYFVDGNVASAKDMLRQKS